MEVAFIVGGLIFVSIMAYIFLMFFYPEWVGITGRATIEEEEAELRKKASQENDPTT